MTTRESLVSALAQALGMDRQLVGQLLPEILAAAKIVVLSRKLRPTPAAKLVYPNHEEPLP
jgi:hypothetical protein